MANIRTVVEGEVDLKQAAHFVIYYGHQWQEIAVLSATPNIEDARIQFLEHGLDEMIVEKIFKELNFYLFELKHPKPIDYLVYHCSTMSNVYSDIHFLLQQHLRRKTFFSSFDCEANNVPFTGIVPGLLCQLSTCKY